MMRSIGDGSDATWLKRGETAEGRSSSTGGAGGADANSSEFASTGAGGGTELFGTAGLSHSHRPHWHERSSICGFGLDSLQQCMVHIAQQGVDGFFWIVVAAGMGGAEWLGQAHALTGIAPTAVETASSTHSTERA